MASAPSGPSASSATVSATQSAPSPTSSITEEGGWWEKFKEFIAIPLDKSVLRTLPDLGHLSPIIISIGSAFVAIVTLNYPLAVLSASSVEAYFVYNTLNMVGKYGATPDLSIPDKVPGDTCKSSFQRMTISQLTLK